MYKKLLLGIGTVGILCAASGSVAVARTMPASAGHALNGADMTCFSYQAVTGGVTSGCSSPATKKFIVPLPIDTFGSKTVSFTSRTNGSGGQCRVNTNNQSGSAGVSTPFIAIPTSGTFVNQTFAAINVPTNGVLFIECDMNIDSKLHSFTYPQ
jgi:hypothetical protein